MKSNFIYNLFWRLIPKKIYGLVGPPGTGKSFRAFLVAEKHKIPFVIDDGLLLKDHKIIVGSSAKKELYHISAVKRAIFHDNKHAREVRKALRKHRYTGVLIIATSDNMLNKIIQKLHLPKVKKIIRIEDIATADEMRIARQSRIKHGKHVVPVPLVEMKKKYPNLVLHAIHMFVDEPKGFIFKKKHKKLIEKTIIRPDFGKGTGSISITDTALVQMVTHCIQEYSSDIKLLKVSVEEENDSFNIIVRVSIGHNVNQLDAITVIQKVIKDKIGVFTGMDINKVDIAIEGSH